MSMLESTFTKFCVNVPPGRLGIHIVDEDLGGNGAIVSAVNKDSSLADRLKPGDQIDSINGIDVSRMNTTGMYLISYQNFNPKTSSYAYMGYFIHCLPSHPSSFSESICDG